jgi:hypothetical protein
MLAFVGLNMALYFSSQGAGKIIGPVLSQTGRLLFIAVGGSWLTSIDAPDTSFFILTASSMAALGLTTALIVWMTPWQPRPRKA